MEIELFLSNFKHHQPSTLTVITTYKCNAACTNCCFECNPQRQATLTLDRIKDNILNAKRSYPKLQLVVFTGGECFTLGQNLFEAISFASSLGLHTRCVTNGYWGKTKLNADKVAIKLLDAGLSELNISTGIEHQEWVSIESIINAAESTSQLGFRPLIMVEEDTYEGKHFEKLVKNEKISTLLLKNLINIQSNCWVDFRENKNRTKYSSNCNLLYSGCSQLFNNIVITPHNYLASCCGLTLEHIPSLKLGNLENNTISELYKSQFDEFIKIWLYVDGPYKIINKVCGYDYLENKFGIIHHQCQACFYLFQDKHIINCIKEQYKKHIVDVLSSLVLKNKVEQL
ncbi:hypothetical protein KEC58_21545 (plasmid) [Photobacterium damselae]|uniref:radical SAM protein n=1 Tax=Photobacterium damselae TaxID=38293 RepID=UPI002542B85D